MKTVEDILFRPPDRKDKAEDEQFPSTREEALKELSRAWNDLRNAKRVMQVEIDSRVTPLLLQARREEAEVKETFLPDIVACELKVEALRHAVWAKKRYPFVSKESLKRRYHLAMSILDARPNLTKSDKTQAQVVDKNGD